MLIPLGQFNLALPLRDQFDYGKLLVKLHLSLLLLDQLMELGKPLLGKLKLKYRPHLELLALLLQVLAHFHLDLLLKPLLPVRLGQLDLLLLGAL